MHSGEYLLPAVPVHWTAQEYEAYLGMYCIAKITSSTYQAVFLIGEL